MKARIPLLSLFLALLAPVADAQWSTESYPLRSGWNAIYPLVDASDVTLDALLASEGTIEEVWRWEPGGIDPLILDEPSSPATGAEWKLWRRGDASASTMNRLLPGFGYLVKVADGTAARTWELKGRTILPAVNWRKDGLNLVGFPVRPGAPAVKIEPYLAPSRLLDLSTEMFRYLGGALEDNPVPVAARAFTDLPRGEAFWINTGRFSDYAAPVHVDVALGDALDYDSRSTTRQLVLRNRTDRALTVTLTPRVSQSNRAGTTPVPVPLLERTIHPVTLNYIYSAIDGPLTIALAAGETVVKPLVADRRSFSGSPGTQLASILEVTDSDGLALIQVPVRATIGRLSGLWVGEARVTRVQNQLQAYERDDDGNYLYETYEETYLDPATGDERTRQNERRIPVGDGSTDLAATAQSFPLRLLVHVDGAGNASLLSTVFHGPIEVDDEVIPGLTTSASLLLPDRFEEASRLRSVHFPLDLDAALSGTFAPGANLATTLVLAHDDPVNPFVHTYHPDHDNLDARFENPLPAGRESFSVTRAVSLRLDADGGDGADPAWGSDVITGTWVEVIDGLHKHTLVVEGPFVLQRLSDIETLQRP